MKSRNKNSNRKSSRRRYCFIVLGAIIIASVIVIACLPLLKKKSVDTSVKSPTSPSQDVGKVSIKEQEKSKSAFAKPAALKDTANKGFPAVLSRSDFDTPRSIGELNLLCAQGLPGAEDLDIKQCLKTLDEWAELVKKETERCLPMYRRNPGEYYNSEAYFRMLVLITVLQKDFGATYNMELADFDGLTMEDLKKPFTSDSRNTFIHGLLTGKRKGTCASMPTLTVAIGRILGYPVYLACAKYHTFVRWEDEKERINFEVTNGLGIYSDEHYSEWPMKMTQEEKSSNYYIKPCTPVEEYSLFLQIRISILSANGRYTEAKELAEAVKQLTPNCPYSDEGIDQLASAEAMQRMTMSRISAEKATLRINTVAYTAREAFSRADAVIHNKISSTGIRYSAELKEKLSTRITANDRSGEAIIQHELDVQKLKTMDEMTKKYLKAKIKKYDEVTSSLFRTDSSMDMKDTVQLNEAETVHAISNHLLIEKGPVSFNSKLCQGIEDELSQALPPSGGLADITDPRETQDMAMRISNASKMYASGGTSYLQFQQRRKQQEEMDAMTRRQEIERLVQQVSARENGLRQVAEEILRISKKRFENRFMQR
ncbi:MAG TPA: hypothetical protein DET40_10080 [Lentisphaeria bacterium]|nr:hypothetical protein [Lentisphaeria bacterium]